MAEYELYSGPFAATSVLDCEELRAGGLEAGVSGSAAGAAYPALYGSFSPPARRWGSYKALGPLSPRSGGGAGAGAARFFFAPGCEDEPRHFLDSCSLCRKPLGRNRDIYMYRGDMPFCSEECRQEQIEMDEASEKSWSLSLKASASRKEQQKQKGKASQGIQVRAPGTVVAG